MRAHSALLGHWVDPALAYEALCGDAEHAFWLDGGIDAADGMSYVGLGAPVELPRADILSAVRTALGERMSHPALPAGFALGLVGWLGFELHAETMGTTPADAGEEHPRAAMLRVESALAFDHAAREVYLLTLGDPEVWRARVAGALESVTSVREIAAGTASAAVQWATTDEQYLDMVRECQRVIREGDAYQLCLTTKATVEVAPDPVATYLALRRASPTHHGALLRTGTMSLLAASPERFLSVTPDGVVRTSPIKGTRPRGLTPTDDDRLAAELIASDKERAENLMIVDLMRNDLTRVCEVGSVEVTSLLAVESYAQVHQLVSTVRGRLRGDVDAIDAVSAAFPAGSMTGAPKRSALDNLSRIEGRNRGVYAGAFGYFGFDGTVDLAMVIRSIVLDGTSATIGTGGGITALSVPAEELAETRVKAAALLRVLGVSDPG